MLRCFGYHHAYSDAVGVNAFFVHESAVGQQPLLSIADAQRAFTKGGQFPPLHGDCKHHAWVRIDDDVDFSDASLDVGSLPVVFLGHNPGGNSQREFYEVKVPTGWLARLGSKADKHGPKSGVLAQLPTSAAAAAVQQQPPWLRYAGAARGRLAGKEADMQGWSLAVLLLMMFACGVMTQRFGGRLLHAGLVALRMQQSSKPLV